MYTNVCTVQKSNLRPLAQYAIRTIAPIGRQYKFWLHWISFRYNLERFYDNIHLIIVMVVAHSLAYINTHIHIHKLFYY
jgi:hypothetical protein